MIENASSSIVPTTNKPSSTKNLLQLGIGCFCFITVLFFVYRFVKNINKRLGNLEEVLGRLIEKNNQMHHYIQQQQARPMQIQPSPPVAQPPQPPQPPQQQQPQPQPQPLQPPIMVAPTSSVSPVVSKPPIDLDAELQAELEELTSAPPAPTPPPTPPSRIPIPKPIPVETAAEKKEDDIPEGRLS